MKKNNLVKASNYPLIHEILIDGEFSGTNKTDQGYGLTLKMEIMDLIEQITCTPDEVHALQGMYRIYEPQCSNPIPSKNPRIFKECLRGLIQFLPDTENA